MFCFLVLLLPGSVLQEALDLSLDPRKVGLDVGVVLVATLLAALDVLGAMVDKTNDALVLAFAHHDGSARITIADRATQGGVICAELVLSQEGWVVLLADGLAGNVQFDLVKDVGVHGVSIITLVLDD